MNKSPGWDQWGTAELRFRRAELLAGLPRVDRLLPGALVEQHRNCGKQGCRCTRGEPHGPYVYLQVAGRLMYVPSALAEVVRAHVEISQRLREALEEISQINVELLSRRELD
ncbi:MAG: DUF6788 family protein [Pseudonocardiaceae bacterium]